MVREGKDFFLIIVNETYYAMLRNFITDTGSGISQLVYVQKGRKYKVKTEDAL